MNIFKSILIILCLTFASCGRVEKKGLVKFIVAGNRIERAERFTLVQKNRWTEVKIIDPWQGATGVNQIYYLVKRGSVLPGGVDSSACLLYTSPSPRD